MSAPTALVTGSAGFIGRNFTRHLRAEGWRVLGIDVRPAGNGTRIEDALDYFRSPLSSVSYDLVIHAAAVVGGRSVIENDPVAQAVNLALDAEMFRWARRVRPGRVIYFSSAAAYPVHLQAVKTHRKLTETDITLPGDSGKDAIGRPDSLYGWAKLTGEYLARLAREAGVAVTVVRPFSGYGSDQDETYPFGAFAARAARREDPFLIWGDGEQVRDFIHVDDIIGTVMRMYELDENGPWNLGWGTEVSLNELAKMFCKAAGYSPQFEHARSAPAGVSWRVSVPGRMWMVYRAQVTLDQGVGRALEYQAGLVRSA